MVLFIYLFLIMAVGLILKGIGETASSAKLKARRLELTEAEVAAHSFSRKRHPFLFYLFPFSQKLLERFKLDVEIKTRLEAAHLKLSVQEFFNLKLLVIIVLGILTFFILGKFEPLGLLVAAALGYIISDFILNKKIAQRKHTIARVIPETVDLLGLCVDAGLDFTTAVKWIVETKIYTNPMIEELSLALEEIKWGKPRIQVLKDMAKRLNIPEVSSFVQTMVQAEKMGTPVAEAFTILSEDTRLQRFHRGERFAMQAPLKILIPLVFCILPVIAIVIGGPIFLQFMQGGLFVGIGR